MVPEMLEFYSTVVHVIDKECLDLIAYVKQVEILKGGNNFEVLHVVRIILKWFFSLKQMFCFCCIYEEKIYHGCIQF